MDTPDHQFLIAGPRVRVPLAEIHFTFARSSGPGGQNVNKVNSKAILRWNVAGTTSLPADIKQRFLEKFRSKVTQSGDVVIASERFRDQPKNVADCLQRLREWLCAATAIPKIRRPSRPTRGSRERRLQDKRKQSSTKRNRRDSNWES